MRPQREAFRASLLDYLKHKEEVHESVKLSEVENIARRHIPECFADQAETIVGELIAHLNSEDCAVPVEFPVSANAMRRFTHIKGASNSWSMVFDRSALGTDNSAEVYYDREAKKLTLRNVPSQMLQVIEDELKSRVEG